MVGSAPSSSLAVTAFSLWLPPLLCPARCFTRPISGGCRCMAVHDLFQHRHWDMLWYKVIAGLLAVLALLALLLCTVAGASVRTHDQQCHPLWVLSYPTLCLPISPRRKAYVLREHRKRSKVSWGAPSPNPKERCCHEAASCLQVHTCRQAEARPAKHEDFKRPLPSVQSNLARDCQTGSQAASKSLNLRPETWVPLAVYAATLRSAQRLACVSQGKSFAQSHARVAIERSASHLRPCRFTGISEPRDDAEAGKRQECENSQRQSWLNCNSFDAGMLQLKDRRIA